MDDRPFYHDGMRDLQDRFDGRRVPEALEKHRIRHDFWDADRGSYFWQGNDSRGWPQSP